MILTFSSLQQTLTSHSSYVVAAATLHVSPSFWGLGWRSSFYLACAFLTAKVTEQRWDGAAAPRTSAWEAFIASAHVLVATVSHRVKPDDNRSHRSPYRVVPNRERQQILWTNKSIWTGNSIYRKCHVFVEERLVTGQWHRILRQDKMFRRVKLSWCLWSIWYKGVRSVHEEAKFWKALKRGWVGRHLGGSVH